MMITCGVVLLNLMSLQSLTRWTLAFHHLLANITVWLNPSVWTERWCLRMNWNLSCCWVQHYNVTEANAHQICCLILKYDLINQKVTILSSDNRLYLFFRSQMYLCHNFALCFLTVFYQSDLPLDGGRHGVWTESVQVGAGHVSGAAIHHLLQVDGRVQLEPEEETEPTCWRVSVW